MPNGTFDVAVNCPKMGRALRQLRRVLKPKGQLAIIERTPDPGYALIEEVVGWVQGAGCGTPASGAGCGTPAGGAGIDFISQSGNALAYTLSFRSSFQR